jgi:hypothetical protein
VSVARQDKSPDSVPITPEAHANNVRARIRALNTAAEDAAYAGLHISYQNQPKRHYDAARDQETQFVLLVPQITEVRYL